MVARLQYCLQMSLTGSPQSLVVAAVQAGIMSNNSLLSCPTSISFEERFEGTWARIEVPASKHFLAQTVDFHLIDGTLLLNGKPVERELPPKIRSSPALARLFPNRRPMVYPSMLFGMTYMLAFPIEGNEIHFGFRQGTLVIRTWSNGMLLEYVPDDIFVGATSFDLPAPLVDGCVHWLDLQSNVIEIRKMPKIWRSAPAHWRIDLNSRLAMRRGTTLLDPSSALFHHFANVFRGFEDQRHIIVCQPQQSALSVELRRFELSFFVNANRFLECRQLRAEIDENQDAGTFYGLSSKIVLRDIQNPRQRSIIVPLGPLMIRRHGMHVDVLVDGKDPVYARYFLDDTLGRVTCASEPRLFYTKALLHASTSFCFPDPLTGRTGADEACSILESGSSQPYSPLTPVNDDLLKSIAKLSPMRQFHPPEFEVLESVPWELDLTVTVQDDRYRPLVEHIKQKSDRLSLFEVKDELSAETLQPVDSMDSASADCASAHLAQRSVSRRSIYQPPKNAALPGTVVRAAIDHVYTTRGYAPYQLSQNHVFQMTHLINKWPVELPSPFFLDLIFQNWAFIAGYGDESVKKDLTRLSDCLDIDLASSWGPLVNLYRAEGQDTKYKLLFWTGLICFRDEINIGAIQTLVAFAILDSLKKLDLPAWPSYTQFRPGFRPKVEYLRTLLATCGRPFDAAGMRSRTQKERKAAETAKHSHENNLAKDLDDLAQFMCDQWPCPQPNLGDFSTTVLDLDMASALIAVEWSAMFQNHEFEEHLRQVRDLLHKFRCPPPIRTATHPPATPVLSGPRGFPFLSSNKLQDDVLRGATCATDSGALLASSKTQVDGRHVHADIEELKRIVGELPQVKSVIRGEYRRGLLDSIAALEKHRQRLDQPTENINIVQLDRMITGADSSVRLQFAQLTATAKIDEPGAVWLDIAGMWPVTTYCSVLELLRSTSSAPLASSMRLAIVRFGLAITRLQRLLRIDDALRRRKAQQVEEETRNPGHSNWSPMDYPDWLLLEIDANILIRPIQVDVAIATINPASSTNSVLQLNMGQGKTSTIIPLVAAVLADGKSLCRVVVPKALLLQTAQLLQLRLGGLLGRELRHVPFSRRSPSDCDTIRAYGNVHRDICKSSGVIIALPEHMMSFMLSGQQRLLHDKPQEAGQMIKVQDWILRKSRDIFDECDFTMAVKTQLIYPSGPQVVVDGGNYRWEAIETILQLAQSHLKALERTYESSIQVVTRETGGFPFFYFLRNDVQDALVQCIATDVCTGRTPLLNADNYSAADKQAIKAFITEPSPQKSVISRASDIHRASEADGYVIYLLRGLLVHRILVLTLSRRWNINFGLNPSRDPISVPFLAKGIPSQLAEWGHVDVSLLLTCLSFYYQGLSQEQLKQSLDQILKSDDPAREYEQWWGQECTTLSDRHRDWASINLEDPVQLNEIWLGVRHSIAAVNHFMNNFVFPKHAKQFKVKLQASGWDLPLAGSGKSLTTGFSGTNDNRLALPLTITQGDLEGLAHTNAEVLTLLLQPRNRSYCLAGFREDKYGRSKYFRMSEQQMLTKLHDRKIRVLIDSGALVLESTNEAVAKTWLDIDTEAVAAIYFADDNRAMVLYRAGRKIPLLASPFAEDLTNCLVYLDEAHTRGTDMKFPPFARGAVTLSLGQTKDHTVQGVGRLRMLSSTQAVTFFAPPEVHRSILDFRRRADRAAIDSHDVICWLLEQTCQGLENLQPLYYGQGMNYCRRIQAARDHPQYLDNPGDRHAYLDTIRTHEQQSLKVLYEPRSEKPRRRVRDEKFDKGMRQYVKQLEQRRKAFQDTGNAVHASALQEVEQEREVAVEVETVRQKQNQLFFSPQNFSGLAERIREFMMTGTLRTDYTMFEERICETAFSYMARTATSLKYPASLPETPQLFVSAEFRRAVAVTSGRPIDDFLRPVQWILWSMTTEVALIVSPEEAELLIPFCRTAAKQVVHLLTYAPPVTQKMLPFGELTFYATPALPTGWSAPTWLKVQIGIFAGGLYFPFRELQPIRELLGLNDDLAADLDELRLEDESPSDGNQTSTDDEQHHTDEIRQARAIKIKVTKMLRFLHAWLATRSRGQDFTHTPMGYICARKVLTQDHPFFRTVDQNEALRKETRNAMADENPQFSERTKDEEHDNASDNGDDDVDERQKLTEEEMRQSEELTDMTDIESNGASNEDDDESDSSGIMFGD
ncbi:hypothetical protein H2200_008851 [Cladophialophora chaetospira]|uniref:ubiquitinyl hydrolase 1 n=1 Tax=Cladophialophora chaetospira TaxID=386627 RepID=A0AA38X4Z2_9EURO|nr:hypothetical protein H2200_008851 [Cladophialophora chaetospira]